ncbi:hypothetical protein B0H15DRAFT_814631 [Mycena belliarum]|uniref:Uncharacterized protein n=1 Tax=Mycena belliarum TaxID=1033014 RepID=A0AAD6XTP1_9AGAR|nr:hypothetical protein B0H15DRAFT_814631 [Mycena belliae]
MLFVDARVALNILESLVLNVEPPSLPPAHRLRLLLLPGRSLLSGFTARTLQSRVCVILKACLLLGCLHFMCSVVGACVGASNMHSATLPPESVCFANAILAAHYHPMRCSLARSHAPPHAYAAPAQSAPMRLRTRATPLSVRLAARLHHYHPRSDPLTSINSDVLHHPLPSPRPSPAPTPLPYPGILHAHPSPLFLLPALPRSLRSFLERSYSSELAQRSPRPCLEKTLLRGPCPGLTR